MNHTVAETFAAIGLLAAVFAVIIHIKDVASKWEPAPKWIAFLAVIAGACLGTSGAALAGINITQYKIGVIPDWALATAAAGLLFILEWRGFKDHPVRTPVLGFATAGVLMLATGGLANMYDSVVAHSIQATAVVVPLHHHHHHHHHAKG